MNPVTLRYYERLVEQLIPELKRRNIDALYCRNREEAREAVLGMIPAGSSVQSGGSVTLTECGIVDALQSGNYQYHKSKIMAEPDEARRMVLRREATIADYYLGSANAVAATGEIVNMDGGGSRVGPYAYGGGKVIMVAGVNKIVPSQEDAIRHVRHHSAVQNVIREGTTAPCGKDGVCHNSECYPPDRMCGKLLIIEKESRPGRITIVFVGEELGL